MSKSSHESWKVSVLDKAATKYERNASALLEAISATQLAALIEDNNSDLFTELLVKTVELIECMLMQLDMVAYWSCEIYFPFFVYGTAIS